MVVAGVDVGNATTEVVMACGDEVLGAGRVPTRGRKGSADSLRGAAALVRRLERQFGQTVTEARIAPLRAVDTSVVTVPDAAPPGGRLRVLAAGVPTPGGTGACVGPPLLVADPGRPASGGIGPGATGPGVNGPGGAAVVAIVPPGLRYDHAAAALRELLAAGISVGAVLAAGDEGVLIANRLPGERPVIDQVDTDLAAGCELIAVEARPPGRALSLLTDPVALGSRFGLSGAAADTVAALTRTLTDYANAVVGLWPASPGQVAPGPDEPWVLTSAGRRIPLRDACAQLPGWRVGAIQAFGAGESPAGVDDLFAVDLAAAAEAATARQHSTGRAVLVASLRRAAASHAASPADQLGELLDVPVGSPLTEPAAARLGALTTPGAHEDALIADLGAGTVDVIGPQDSVVAAGAGELLTAVVAELLGIPRAAADWVKRGPCVRIEAGQRFEAEDGTRGFLDVSAPAAGSGMLAVRGPGGLLPFDRRHGPGEWRAIRLRLKLAVLACNFQRAMRTLGQEAGQVLVVGGPAGDEELLGVLARSLPGHVAVGRGHLGGTSRNSGLEPLGHRYAVALGLALAAP